MSTNIVNASENSSETAKSLGLKIISVVGLTLFTGFYVNSWQRSLAEYDQQQTETTVTTSQVAPIADTTQTVSEETAPIKTEMSIVVPETEAAPKITDSNTLDKLNSMLYNQINQTWKQYPTFSENLVYQVTMTSAGTIAKYAHINQAASEYIGETPLPQLINNQENTQKSTAEFLVVLTPSGVLQVNQWTAK
ncbi:MAG: hypothetical protein AB4080_01335 [Trichodesmium sp.]